MRMFRCNIINLFVEKRTTCNSHSAGARPAAQSFNTLPSVSRAIIVIVRVLLFRSSHLSSFNHSFSILPLRSSAALLCRSSKSRPP